MAVEPVGTEGDGDCPAQLVEPGGMWGLMCTRNAGHPPKHEAGVMGDRVVARWDDEDCK
jgi:hypothetical protein